MYLKQISNDKTGCVSYTGYCASCGAGYVVDPLEDIEPYLQIAKNDGIKITHIFNTHVQADHISGDRKLADKTGAKIYR
jgi:hydroxyacylglutathione hydrolase